MLSTKYVYKSYINLIYTCKQDLALNNLQWSIFHKTNQTKTEMNKQPPPLGSLLTYSKKFSFDYLNSSAICGYGIRQLHLCRGLSPFQWSWIWHKTIRWSGSTYGALGNVELLLLPGPHHSNKDEDNSPKSLNDKNYLLL